MAQILTIRVLQIGENSYNIGNVIPLVKYIDEEDNQKHEMRDVEILGINEQDVTLSESGSLYASVISIHNLLC